MFVGGTDGSVISGTRAWAGEKHRRTEFIPLPLVQTHETDSANEWCQDQSVRRCRLSVLASSSLAAGLKMGQPVLTAERAWAKPDVGVSVGLIR
jgi:hypothetical protein